VPHTRASFVAQAEFALTLTAPVVNEWPGLERMEYRTSEEDWPSTVVDLAWSPRPSEQEPAWVSPV